MALNGDTFTVRVQKPRTMLAEAMSEMRIWLDHHHIELVNFGIAETSASGTTLDLRFRHEAEAGLCSLAFPSPQPIIVLPLTLDDAGVSSGRGQQHPPEAVRKRLCGSARRKIDSKSTPHAHQRFVEPAVSILLFRPDNHFKGFHTAWPHSFYTGPTDVVAVYTPRQVFAPFLVGDSDVGTRSGR